MIRSWLLVLASCGGAEPGNRPKSVDCEPGRCIEDISRVVKQHRDDARSCFDIKPELPAGEVMIKFEIDASGTVTEAAQSMKAGQLEDAELGECISDVVKRIKFVASAKGEATSAYHVFEFSRRNK